MKNDVKALEIGEIDLLKGIKRDLVIDKPGENTKC